MSPTIDPTFPPFFFVRDPLLFLEKTPRFSIFPAEGPCVFFLRKAFNLAATMALLRASLAASRKEAGDGRLFPPLRDMALWPESVQLGPQPVKTTSK